MRRPTEKLIAGIDLHGNNLVIGVMNQDGKRLTHRKLDCELDQVVDFLKPLKSRLQSMAVESTFNWYWLVDGLRAQGYPIDLANPAQIEQRDRRGVSPGSVRLISTTQQRRQPCRPSFVSFALRTCLGNDVDCRSRRQEAGFTGDSRPRHSLLTSAPTISKHALISSRNPIEPRR